MEVGVHLSRALRLIVLALAWLLLIHPSIAAAIPDHTDNTPAMVRIPGHVLPALSKATALTPTDRAAASESRRPLMITIVLKRDDQPAFDRYLHDLYDRHSKNFHRFLSQREIADRFGPSRQTYHSVLGYLQSKGFHLVEGSKNRLTLTMRGAREQAERAFGVNIGDYQVGKTQFFANDQDPAIPTQMASSVESVIGLSNLAELGLRHGHMMDGINGLKGCYAANSTADPNSPAGVLATACGVAYVYAAILYDLGCLDQQAVTAGYEPCNRISVLPVFAAPAKNASATTHSSDGSDPSMSSAVPGTGQTIGLVEFDSYNQSDVSDFLALVSAQAQISQLKEVKLDGGASIGSGESEVLLDIDTVMMLAPGANVSVYSAPFTGSGASFQTVLNHMIDDKVTVISNSWAYCEDETTSADVNSIDMIFQNAAAAGISAFNGAGDTGSTCLDGSANTVAVPADSPHATAVGGSSVVVGPAGEYEGETWWNGSNSTPQTGQGGFGLSKFFTAPGYQTGLSAMRSVPDVVANADPAANGVVICEADKGGCPTNLLFGGTSIAAPIWAAFTADLNQAQGANLGQINPSIYPLAGTNAFHTPASMGSDFAHVGLGSPNISALSLELQSASVGAVSASMSQASTSSMDVPDDGTSKGYVAVQLRDSNGNVVPGKTVTLAANGGSHAEITPSSGITSVSNGAVIFSVTDLDAETVNFTADDMTDSITVTPTGSPSLTFATAPSTQAAIGAFPTTVTADGAHSTTITVTLEDTLGRPSPGKEIQITQNGNSVITGPVPQVTDATGKIEFTGYDTDNETVTYAVTDVTDGSLAFPETAQVTFSSGPEPGCGNGNTISAPGYLATPYVTGLFSENFSFAGGDFGGCPGAWGLAFDASGNLYVGEEFNGAIYKIPSGGGAASVSNLIGTIGPTLGQLVFDNGNLYGVRASTGGNLGTGAVLQIDPTSGAVLNTVVGNLNCPLEMAVDPLSGDLFVDDGCEGPNGSGDLLRISHLATIPTVSTYAILPHQGNYQITFAADGTIYVFSNAGDGQIIKVGGTASTQPASVNVLAGPIPAAEFLAASGSAAGGGAKLLIFGTAIGTLSDAVAALDLTTGPPSTGSILVNSGMVPAAENATFGPDGCLYIANGNEVLRISKPDGTCSFASLSAPSLVLTPTSVSPNPAQGSAQTLNASIHSAAVTAGIPVLFSVTGANPQIASVNTNASGQASFTYTAAHEGADTISASAVVSGNPTTSNQAVITWGPGTDVTAVSLNQSPKGAVPGQAVNLIASLTDVSQTPPTALSGETINFSAGSQHCSASTNAQGIATCEISASGSGLETLTATFAGTAELLASNESDSFNVLTVAPTPTATATSTATPTATVTPVAGKLKISPKALNFGSVEIGASPIKSLKITNAGKVKKKKVALPILIEMESGVASPFTLTQECDDDDLRPKSKGVAPGSCEVSVKFTPTAAIKYSGTLMIDTNVEPMPDRSVKLEGSGKAPKQ